MKRSFIYNAIEYYEKSVKELFMQLRMAKATSNPRQLYLPLNVLNIWDTPPCSFWKALLKAILRLAISSCYKCHDSRIL